MGKLSSQPNADPIDPLTRREREILALLADQRLSNQDIAQRLVLSARTVKWYTHQIYEKLDVNDRSQAVTRARKLGLLPTDQPSSAPPSHHLPVPLTPFLGRERQVAQIIHMLRDSGARLVTLTGAGGVGKTRLAIKVAEEMKPSIPTARGWSS